MKKRGIRQRLLRALLTAVLLAGFSPLSGQAKEEGVSGEFANIVVFARFQGDGKGEDYFNEGLPGKTTGDNTLAEEIMYYYNGDYGRSVTRYMETVSNGTFHVKNLFPQYDEATGRTEVIALKEPYTEGQKKNIDNSVIRQVIEAMPELSGITADYDGDGYIDNLSIILAGGIDHVYNEIPTLYPHQYTYGGTETAGGKKVLNYNMLTTASVIDGSLLAASRHGVLIHELLHSIGYPDLYTRSGAEYPVHSWDIMGERSIYPAYPLAALREKSGWTEVPVITEDTVLTLETPAGSDEGKPYAYAIESPLNPYELFVVENRVQGDKNDGNSLDAGIGGSGVIVYRVDTTVENLSNFGSKYGIYIFRPGNDDRDKTQILNAAFPRADGTDSIGNEEIEAGIGDGALTFSDGSNSGIVISGIESEADGKVSLSVHVPDKSQYDLWEDTQLYEAAQGKGVTHAVVAEIGNEPYAAAVRQTGKVDGVKPTYMEFYKYQDGEWKETWKGFRVEMPGSQINGGSCDDLQMFEADGTPGIAYTNGSGTLYLKTWDGKKWNAAASLPSENVTSFDVAVSGNSVYLACIEDSMGAELMRFTLDQKTLKKAGETVSYLDRETLAGDARVEVIEDVVYAAARNAQAWDNDELIELHSYDSALQSHTKRKGMTRADFGFSPSGYANISYSMTAYGERLYIAGSTTEKGLCVMEYEPAQDTWDTYAQEELDSAFPEIMTAGGNMYVLTGPATEKGTGTRLYRASGRGFVQEGVQVDAGAGRAFHMAAIGETIYVSYYVENTSGGGVDDMSKSATGYVKRKDPENRLLSIEVTSPPDKTDYLVGEAVSTEGLSVTAHYTKESRTLKAGEYTVSGFDTETAGRRTAVVSFEGKTAEFSYQATEAVTGLELTGDGDFGRVCAGYESRTPHTFQVKNTGNTQTEVSVTVTGRDGERFLLSEEHSLTFSLQAGEEKSFDVSPADGLTAGDYEAELKAVGNEEQGAALSFTVTEHAYGEPVFEWAQEDDACTAVFVCENDKSHVQRIQTEVIKETETEADCTKMGTTKYTAGAVFEGAVYSESRTKQDIPALGHSYQNGSCIRCGAQDPSAGDTGEEDPADPPGEPEKPAGEPTEEPTGEPEKPAGESAEDPSKETAALDTQEEGKEPQAEKAEAAETQKAYQGAPTGDRTDAAVYAVLLLGSAGGLFTVIIYRRKNKNSNYF